MSGTKKNYEPVWRETPFAVRNVNYLQKDTKTSLPFSIGGLTQQGPEHFRSNINNQDAMAISISDKLIAAVVCDGCTGSHSELKLECSNNEIGAKLLSRFIIDGINLLIDSADNLSNDEFIKNLQFFVIDKLKAIADILTSNEEEKYIVSDFLMATILGFIVTENSYIVFHSGDGYISVNNVFSEIEDHGVYLSKVILNPDDKINFIKIFNSGCINELENIVLASDGCHTLIDNYQQILIDYIKDTDKLVSGYDSTMFRQFRSKVVWNNDVKNLVSQDTWFDDDATIIILRKLTNN